MGHKYKDYEGEVVSLGRKLLRELKGDYLAVDFFQYICYWVLNNEYEDKNKFDDCYWTYFSVADIRNMPDYDYVTEWQAKRALRCLVELKLVKRGNHNVTAFDRTPWYTVDRRAIEYYQPNLIKLFDKKKARKARENMQPSKGAEPTEDGRNTAHPREDLHPSTGGKPTEALYNRNNNQVNNQVNNQEKELNFNFSYQHNKDNMVVSKVADGDNAHTRENGTPFTKEEWDEINGEFPKGLRYGKDDVKRFYAWRDAYGFKKFVYALDDARRNCGFDNTREYMECVEGRLTNPPKYQSFFR